MRFRLIDSVLEASEDRVVAVKQVTAAEEYLQDHFPTFPVLPGVFMVEAMAQAARALLERRGLGERFAIGSVRAVKYGAFVRPGETLRVEVIALSGPDNAGAFEFRGAGTVLAAGEMAGPESRNAVSGRFTLRPVNPVAG